MRKHSPTTAAIVRDFPHDRRSDADLVREVAAGEVDALTAVWRRHATRVRRTLLGQLGNDPAIDDLLQEVFISFARNADRLQEPDRLLSYLMGAAIRQARQVIRNRTRRRRWLGLWAEERRDDVSRPNVQSRAALRRLREILEDLPVRLRESFVLRFVDGLGTQEVAELRGVSLATAKRDIARAQKRVQKLAERDPALSEYLSPGAEPDRALSPAVRSPGRTRDGSDAAVGEERQVDPGGSGAQGELPSGVQRAPVPASPERVMRPLGDISALPDQPNFSTKKDNE